MTVSPLQAVPKSASVSELFRHHAVRSFGCDGIRLDRPPQSPTETPTSAAAAAISIPTFTFWTRLVIVDIPGINVVVVASIAIATVVVVITVVAAILVVVSVAIITVVVVIVVATLVIAGLVVASHPQLRPMWSQHKNGEGTA